MQSLLEEHLDFNSKYEQNQFETLELLKAYIY